MNTASDKIRAEIAEHGAISFARFMELALYCPDCGFYEKENDTIGRRGDFYTSVSVGPLFGELLAFQFAQWLEELRIADFGLGIVEAGAHDGRLAKDILVWLKLRRPALFERIEYWVVEPSARRQLRQREMLKNFGTQVRWAGELPSFSAFSNPQSTTRNPQFKGVIFSNELLDAMPVHRVGWDAQRREWFEWGVTLEKDRFNWMRLSDPIDASRLMFPTPPELLAALPDGFTTEICPAAESWWRKAGSLLNDGRLLTFDYGLTAEEFFAPQRANGTLRAYHQHQLDADVLANPGAQDITAHVNFTAIQSAGKAVGLRTELLQTQARFLTDILRNASAENSGFGSWTPGYARQFQTLTHPEHLGRAFRVLVQRK